MCRCSPEYAVDDEVDTTVDGDQKVVGLGELVVSLVQVLSTSIISSAGKRSIGFTIGFHNHGEGPYYVLGPSPG